MAGVGKYGMAGISNTILIVSGEGNFYAKPGGGDMGRGVTKKNPQKRSTKHKQVNSTLYVW